MNPFVRIKAEEVLSSYWGEVTPVDPFTIAQRLGIVVRKEFFVGDLSGALIRKPKSNTVIAVNASDSSKRQRFTVAHELGHFTLGHKGELFVDHTILNRRDARSSTALDYQEIEANAFAADLLMPAQLVFSKANAMLAIDPTISQTDLLPRLSQEFDVSEQAMTFRLMNLGFLGIESQ